jgi:hypothetical protein
LLSEKTFWADTQVIPWQLILSKRVYAFSKCPGHERKAFLDFSMTEQFKFFLANRQKVLAIKDRSDYEGLELIKPAGSPPIAHSRGSSSGKSAKRDQGKLLLVALLEVSK